MPPRSYRGTRPRFASGTLMSLRTIPLSLCRDVEALVPRIVALSARARYTPSFLQGTRPRFAPGTLMSLPEGIATPCMCLDSREAHPVLARQLRVCLHKALRSRTRGAENAHTLITHRLKQAQQLRGHVGCRQ